MNKIFSCTRQTKRSATQPLAGADEKDYVCIFKAGPEYPGFPGQQEAGGGAEAITSIENKLQVSLSKESQERISEGRCISVLKIKPVLSILHELVKHGAIEWDRLLADTPRVIGKEILWKCWKNANSRKVPFVY